MIHSIKTVRVGIEVSRHGRAKSDQQYRMFYCRQREPGDKTHCSLAEWASDEVSMLETRGGLPGVQRMRIGETRRYWVQMRMTHTSDYWGEHDTEIEILSCRRAR